MGLLAFADKRYDRAIDGFRRAIFTDPSYVQAYLWLTKTYRENKDIKSAKEEIANLLEIMDESGHKLSASDAAEIKELKNSLQ